MTVESGQERRPGSVIELGALKTFWRQLGKQLDDAQFLRFQELQKAFVTEVQECVHVALDAANEEEVRALLLECHHWHVVTGSGPDAAESVLSPDKEKIRQAVRERVTAFVARVRQELTLDF